MIFLTWRRQHLLLSLSTTRSATGQSKAWRMVLTYSATATTLTNGMISAWPMILINPSVGYFLLPEMLAHFTSPINYPKDLGVLVTRHLKWNSQVLAACSKANRMLGFIRRSAFDTHDQRVRKLLYTSLVRSNLAYCSRCGLLKLSILSLTSKEFSAAQQNSFCLCRIGLKLGITRRF